MENIKNEIKDFLINELGNYLESLGGKQLLGRIWGLLIVSPRPISLKEISNELKVSKPAISTTITIGVQYGVFKKVYNPEYPRENFYKVLDQSFEMMITPGFKKLVFLFEKFSESYRLFDKLEENSIDDDLRKIKNRLEYIKKCFEIFLEEYEDLTKRVVSRINELKYD